MIKFHVKSGDTVKVIAGDSKGKTGVVREIVTSTSKVFVEGLNMVKRHVKPTSTSPNGSIVEKEAAIHISNVALVDPATKETTKTGRRLNKSGKLERYSKKTQKAI